ncbi:hypothetical protein O6H91_05G127000 [Diphasiastrum complanatum]|uniref:Uncharacterized protein n=1 Tax=Diphasiastrum complanatum TaxID=34168 RepID=A0ACC2DSX2_DIPCM|nr:hypothetical protein O6H91_05G127000 [Diphasiastrum complanatum]
MASTLIDSISHIRTQGLPFAAPKEPLRTTEASLVREVLQMLQGLAGAWMLWDESSQHFILRKGTHVSHLSQSSLSLLLQPFLQAATSLRKVELFTRMVAEVVANSCVVPRVWGCPTLEAFGNSVSLQLEWLRNAALEMEIKAVIAGSGSTVTLLSLSASMARVCAGADFLGHVVVAITPQQETHEKTNSYAALMAENILSFLFEELNQFCLLEDGEEDACRTLLLLFVGSLQPYVDSLDTWLQEGNLYDPFGQIFFYSNGSVRLDDPKFWRSGYCLRQHSSVGVGVPLYKGSKIEGDQGSPSHENKLNSCSFSEDDSQKGHIKSSEPKLHVKTADQLTSLPCSEDHQGLICPVFLQPLAKSIVSAGKSLQLLRFVKQEHFDVMSCGSKIFGDSSATAVSFPVLPIASYFHSLNIDKKLAEDETKLSLHRNSTQAANCYSMASENVVTNRICHQQGQGHSLFEQFCLSLQNLLVERSIKSEVADSIELKTQKKGADSSFQKDQEDENTKEVLGSLGCPPNGILFRTQPAVTMSREHSHDATGVDTSDLHHVNSWNMELMKLKLSSARYGRKLRYPDASTVSNKRFGDVLHMQLSLEGYNGLPPLEDVEMREAIFRKNCEDTESLSNEEKLKSNSDTDKSPNTNIVGCNNDGDSKLSRTCTDYSHGDGCGSLVTSFMKLDIRAVQKLLPYPTLLPIFQEGFRISDMLQPQAKDKVVKQILNWLQEFNAKMTLSPAVMVQECLLSFIQKQVITVGRQLLEKLMGEWRLMEELALLRAIYLVGSGDLLQQFTAVLFNKLDRGEPWDDFYELNTLLQESVRSSTDASLQTALDSLFVKVVPQVNATGEAVVSVPLHALGRNLTFDIDTLDSLQFSYKVMLFLLKVKRAKHALDKACRWTWKNGGGDTANHKQQLLLQQKLMHFVNTLHQYVMDRVLYSAWVELCEGMALASSLDEVITCHDMYLTSIQRQCFVAPDKLWTLIASRVKTVLGLALDYYSIQRTLCGGGGSALGMVARCQLEVGKVERQFDECMVFLLRVLSFKLNVGHFPHLTDLITRINYNYYYMSENGHLLTPIPETVQQLKANRS